MGLTVIHPLMNRKHLIKIALKYRSLYKLTSSNMVKAIINDPEFKSFYVDLVEGVDRESQISNQLDKISVAARKNSYNNEQKHLKKLNNEFYGITSPMDLDDLIDLMPSTPVPSNEDIDIIFKRLKNEK